MTNETRMIRDALKLSEGQGVTVYRTIGTDGLSVFDPFLLLDEFVIGKDAKGAGFPNHPHRGFETVTYMLTGEIQHADNAGHSGVIGPGDVQWMTAGRGLIHSEMPKSHGEDVHGFQLWINLAASEKLKKPHYQEIKAESIPTLKLPGGGDVRVISGDLDGITGPVTGISLNPLYLDIGLTAGESVNIPIAEGHNAFVYNVSGILGLDSPKRCLARRQIALLVEGNNAELSALEGPARALLISALPLGEPVARYGPFVMNSPEEIDEALEDFRNRRRGFA